MESYLVDCGGGGVVVQGGCREFVQEMGEILDYFQYLLNIVAMHIK